MELTGLSIIGSKRGQANGGSLNGFNPATGQNLDPSYHFASPAEVDEVGRLWKFGIWVSTENPAIRTNWHSAPPKVTRPTQIFPRPSDLKED